MRDVSTPIISLLTVTRGTLLPTSFGEKENTRTVVPVLMVRSGVGVATQTNQRCLAQIAVYGALGEAHGLAEDD